MRLTVKVSGSGKLQFRLPTYFPYPFDPKTKKQQVERSGFAGGLKHCRTL